MLRQLLGSMDINHETAPVRFGKAHWPHSDEKTYRSLSGIYIADSVIGTRASAD